MQAWLEDSAFLLNAWSPLFGFGFMGGSTGLKKSAGQANGEGAVLGNLRQMLQSADE